MPCPFPRQTRPGFQKPSSTYLAHGASHLEHGYREDNGLQSTANGRAHLPTPGNGAANELPLRILGLGGSTRQGSKSLILLRTALQHAEGAGATVALADVRALDLPVYDQDRP